MKRYLAPQIQQDLKKKMVFVGGPRQVGKTTLARSVAKSFAYFNWDIAEQRKQVLKNELGTAPLLILDELHKYKSWRNYLKGLYDATQGQRQILVTGSARLDLLRRGGDSLQGRYHYLRLHPLSFQELAMKTTKDLELLNSLSGFPEPFFSQSKKETNRWSREYSTRLFREEILSVQQIVDTGNMELLYYRLPELVGSPLSINALREDLQISHHTISRWIEVLETFYGLFRISPFGSAKIRAIKKSQKHYHFDWNLVDNEGARFENLVACHLLKWVHFLEDTEGRAIELRYFRDIDLREVDFVILEKNKPILFIESKLSDGELSKGLLYLKAKFPGVDSWQISLRGTKDYLHPSGIRICPASTFLKELI